MRARNEDRFEGGLQSLDSVRTKFAVVWFGGACVILLLVVVQTLNGRYGDHVQEAWTWLMLNLMPTIGTILAGLGYTALDPHRSHAVVRTSFYLLSFWMSCFYLALVLLTILIAPTRPEGVTGRGAVELMHTANLWLGPLQGLVATALGVLFASTQKRQTGKPGSKTGEDSG
jgi:cytochrome bd-type quinol oxidase subunit 2